MHARDLVDDRPTLVLSPHMDDAILSAFAVCSQVRCDVWTTFAGLPVPAQNTAWDASCGFNSSDETIEARRVEDDRAFAGLPVSQRRLDAWEGAYTSPERRMSDLAMIDREVRAWLAAHPHATLVIPIAAGRYRPPSLVERLRDARRPARDAHDAVTVSEKGVGISVPNAESNGPLASGRAGAARLARGVTGALRRCAQELLHRAYQRRRRLAQRDGMAHNPDHLALRDLVLDIARGTPGTRVLLFEDLPYLWHESGDLQSGLLHRRGLDLRIVESSVNVEAKFRHLQAYSSQMPVLDPAGRLLDPTTIPSVERYWLVES